MFWSRWGGQRIIADLLIGPAGATTAIRTANGCQPPTNGDNAAALMWNGPDPSQDLLSDSACQGAALIDYDQRVLLAYQWHDSYVSFAEGCARLVAAWPGWQVRWAFDGVGDLAAYLGRDRSTVRSEESLTGQPGYGRCPFCGSGTCGEFDSYDCVLSVRRADGAIELYRGSAHLNEMVAPHRFLFEDLPAGFASLNCPVLPRSGVHLDYGTRTAGVWTIEALEGFLDRPHAYWPGWQWHLWGADIREQVTRCDRRLTVPPLPAQLTTAITVVALMTFRHPTA